MLSEDVERLEKIDKLYSLRLDQLISLPVLAVVGDQSSGKSSVLEALTGLPFPRNSTLCTRFPTQIVFKRSQKRHINVGIIPATGSDQSRIPSLHNFSTKWSISNDILKHNDLIEILGETSDLLGLSTNDETEHTRRDVKSFSNDLLKIELSGPNHDHFSVIDLPGLFRKPTEGQTTKEDMTLVRDMVSTHLNNERCIIMAVVPANVDIATQEIIQMAEDADPSRCRTLAVLTKPDLVDKGAEDQVIELVKETNSGPGLGYIVLCNRSQHDLAIPLSERNANEELFFNQLPWKRIPGDRVGVKSLKLRLNSLSVEASRRSFEEVRGEIQKKWRATELQLETLGPPRHTPESERMFLLQMASQYQSLINKATDAHYGRDACFHQNSKIRLATVVMEESQRFASMLAKKGVFRAFKKKVPSTSSDDDELDLKPLIADIEQSESHLDTIGQGRGFPELQRFASMNAAQPKQSNESIEVWIARRYREFRGFEVGSMNPSLITALVFEQTSSWHYYARSYVLRVIERIHRCIYDILAYVCPDPTVHDRLWDFIKPKLMEAYQKALEHTTFLVDVERGGYPVTLNHYFAQTMIKRRQQRLERSLKNMKAWQTNDEARQPLLRLNDILQSLASNEDQQIEELGDVLQSYHKVARKRFTDAVAKQVVDYTLICSKTGPLHVYSPEFVGKLSEADLHKIAAEDGNVSDQRQRLQAEREILEKGSFILQ